MAFSLGGFISGAGHILGGIIKSSPVGVAIDTAAQILHPKPPSGPTVLGNLPAIFTGTPQLSGGGTIKGGGGAPPGGGPPALPQISGGVPVPPGTAVTTLPPPMSQGNVSPQAAYLQGRAAARGVKGHYTKGTARNPSHWSNRRRPRMNPMNVHAARRSVRRLVAGEKLFRKIFRIMHHHKAAVAVKRRK